ncbi:hypothetical protein EYR97_19885 [Alteromonas sp. KUL42]|uniref:hypothetical protein n=1 Tax=Alteromonas sp. KUL42 TaxID=2480797 RepID=UPI001036D360|nr:hypothetical protein [Alteromonas sp. KUL42]TAP31750.1 hypothetical protein EYR97_19885 [Alteromonas sp. KUL42]
MSTSVVFYIRTDSPEKVEKHLCESLSNWEWSISLFPTSAQSVHDTMNVDDNDEPNWHVWSSYIPLSESYGSGIGANYSKALAALHGVKSAIQDLLTSDSTTGEAGEKLDGSALDIYRNG